MRWHEWWLLVVLAAVARAQPEIIPSICEEQSCRCDAFTRVICECAPDDTVILRPDGVYRVPAMATGIIIEGCARVQFLPETVRNLFRLRAVEVRNVRSVIIQERSIAWTPRNTDLDNTPGIRILIENSTINEIASHAVQGRVNSIVFSNSKVNVLKPYAFSSLTGVTNVELSSNVFDFLEIQIFKKFTTSNFILRGNIINNLPSRFLSDVEVTSLFRMEGNSVNHVSSLSFLVSLPERVLIESNTIGTLDGDGFHIATRGPIAIRNNTITTASKGAFLGFSALPEVTSVKGYQELLIDNNTMANISPFSFLIDTNSLVLRIDGLNLNVPCSCELVEEWRDTIIQQGGTFSCWYTLEHYFVSLSTFYDSRCGKFKQMFWIFIVVGVLLVLIVAIVGIVCIVKRERERKKKVQIVMPDGKTYRETEFHIVVERAELLTTDL